MTKIWHISSDGVARRCFASDPSDCRVKIGASIEHFDTKEEAQAAYEKSQEKSMFKPLKNSVERDILLNDQNTLKKTGINAYADPQNQQQRTSLDVAADHLETSQKVNEIIDYNNSNRKADFVFKYNDSSLAEKTEQERSEIFIQLTEQESALKKEYDSIQNKN